MEIVISLVSTFGWLVIPIAVGCWVDWMVEQAVMPKKLQGAK